MQMKLDEIRISQKFWYSTPSQAKYDLKKRYYKTYGEFEKPIIVDERNWLTDGYITYLVAKELGLTEVPVLKDLDYKCVYGHHPNQEKEFMWKIPRKFEDKISVNDLVFCNTIVGIAPVIVDKIDSPPEDLQYKLKKVKYLRREEDNDKCRCNKEF